MLNGFENIPNDISEKLEKFLQPLLIYIQHFDCDNPVKSFIIEDNFKITGPELRALIRYLRRLGYPIGSFAKGYYYIRTKEELEATLSHLTQRKDSIEKTILEMKHIEINKSIQQLNLNMQ